MCDIFLRYFWQIGKKLWGSRCRSIYFLALLMATYNITVIVRNGMLYGKVLHTTFCHSEFKNSENYASWRIFFTTYATQKVRISKQVGVFWYLQLKHRNIREILDGCTLHLVGGDWPYTSYNKYIYICFH